MQRESADFPGAVCDKTRDSSDGCRWCYVTAGLWDGEPNNSGKNNKSIERESCDFLTKCKICKKYAKNMHYMQNNMNENM
jgi:hypothetical protein